MTRELFKEMSLLLVHVNQLKRLIKAILCDHGRISSIVFLRMVISFFDKLNKSLDFHPKKEGKLSIKYVQLWRDFNRMLINREMEKDMFLRFALKWIEEMNKLSLYLFHLRIVIILRPREEFPSHFFSIFRSIGREMSLLPDKRHIPLAFFISFQLNMIWHEKKMFWWNSLEKNSLCFLTWFS